MRPEAPGRDRGPRSCRRACPDNVSDPPGGPRPADRHRLGTVASVATLAAIVPFAVIAFDFDPLLHFGDRALRFETLALAGCANPQDARTFLMANFVRLSCDDGSSPRRFGQER